jgi:tetratricopeptide (TPR) repeat protein
MTNKLKLAEDFLKRGYNLKAIEFAEKYIAETNNLLKGFEIIGTAYFQANKFHQSIEYLNKSVEADSKNSNSFFILGSIYIKLSEWENAILMIEKAIQIDKKNCNYLYQLVLC